MARARRDLRQCLDFIAAQPWGDVDGRERDIHAAMRVIRHEPEWRRVELTRKCSGAQLRRRSAAQFVIVYVYFKPKKRLPKGLVSIRAIRHRRVRNVFLGVRDPSGEHPPQYG